MDKITLFNDSQQPVEMEIIATLQLNNRDYAILHAIDDDEDYIFAVTGEGDENVFSLVEDDIERQDIIDAYYELVDGE